MTRVRLGPLVIVVVLLGVYWIASNTEWTSIKVPMPPRGEALTNPFYAVQRFADALGAHTRWDRTLRVPRADAVIVLASWNWNLSRPRRESIERWVEAGGRLVVDWSLVG